MTNVGSIDRIVRIVIGMLLLAFAIPVGVPPNRLELDRLDWRGARSDRCLRLLSGLFTFGDVYLPHPTA